ncbi:MAG: hypothetical protein WCC19_03105 [Terriglobales bacterium]
MNFIGRMEGQEIRVGLKYCERCGGLWLRPQGADGVYCAGCRVRLAELPNSGGAPLRQGRRRKERVGEAGGRREQIHSSAHIEYLQGVAAMEVRA